MCLPADNPTRYMFDEPSSYLDVKQRLKAAEVIRSLLTPANYVIAVEHDLSVLDYLSDFVCCLYGKPSMYGVVTMPYSVREGNVPFSPAACVVIQRPPSQVSTYSWMVSFPPRICDSGRSRSRSKWSKPLMRS